MDHLATTLRRRLARLGVFDQLVGLGAGVLAVLALAATLALVGTSSERALEEAWTPSAGQLP